MNTIFVFHDTDIVTIVRVALAFLLGGVVGFEREWKRSPAGLRTHMLVSAGSATFTVAALYGFQGLGPSDPSRIIAQIITGIGFIGAGAIFRSGSSVRGLTTATSIWMVAAIGVVAGLGMLWLALFTTALTYFALQIVKLIERLAPRPRPSRAEERAKGLEE